MDIDVGSDAVIAQRLTDHGANGRVRDVMVIHDVEVHPIGAGIKDCLDLLPQAREIRG